LHIEGLSYEHFPTFFSMAKPQNNFLCPEKPLPFYKGEITTALPLAAQTFPLYFCGMFGIGHSISTYLFIP